MKLRIKGLVIGGILCCMTIFTGCSSITDFASSRAESMKETLGILFGIQDGENISEETDVNKNAYIIDESVQKPTFIKDLGAEEVTGVVNGEITPLSVECQVSDGGQLSYQWYRNNVDANGGGTVLEGETFSTFTPPTTEEGIVYYYVVVTNNIDDHIQLVTSKTQKVTLKAEELEATTESAE